LRLERDGDPESALDVLLDAWRRGSDARYLLTWRSVAPDLVRLAVSQSATALADEVTAVAQEGARQCDAASAQAAARRCEGLFTGDIALLLEAAVHFDAAGRPLDKAASIADAARIVRATDATRGRVLLRDAADLYASVGANGEAARLAAMLGRGRPPARAALGWDAVTAAEWEVVRLAAAGMTNPQIAAEIGLSRHTVATHLRHVFSKVGVTTRAALAAAVAGRAATSTPPN
jgi:DNA-binding CsgD family transcriptional regulator